MLFTRYSASEHWERYLPYIGSNDSGLLNFVYTPDALAAHCTHRCIEFRRAQGARERLLAVGHDGIPFTDRLLKLCLRIRKVLRNSRVRSM